MEPTCPSENKWINKLWYIHTWNIIPTLKSGMTQLDATRWMKLEEIMLGEISSYKKTDTVGSTAILGV